MFATRRVKKKGGGRVALPRVNMNIARAYGAKARVTSGRYSRRTPKLHS